MEAGRLRHRVTFLEPVSVEEPDGSERIDFVPRFRRFAAVLPVKAAEAMRGNQPLALLDTRIVTRWDRAIDAVSEKWRAVHRGVTYGIESIANAKMADREVEFLCKSGAIS